MFNWKRASVIACLLLATSRQHESEAWTPSSFTGSKMSVAITSSSSATRLSMQIPMLDAWEVDKKGRVKGVIKNHPVIEDGDVVTTSAVTDPDSAGQYKIVVTSSGSKYKLGVPKAAPKAASKNNGKAKPAAAAKAKPEPVKAAAAASSAVAEQENKEQKLKNALREAKIKYGLNGDEIGGGKYLLAGKGKRSTSGKSQIYTAYRSDENGLPVGDALTIKVSPNYVALKREADNYGKITRGLTRGCFVNFYEYIEQAGTNKKFASQCAVVLEKGEKDVKDLMNGRRGGLKGRELRDAAAAAAQCLQAAHASNLVWTDLKAENLIIQTNGGKLAFKGIDLESAMPMNGNPVDYSPEACPPEFAKAFLSGNGADFRLNDRYDVWSFGMLLFELSSGNSYFGNKSPAQITKLVNTPGFTVNTNTIENDKMKDLINQCCQIDPKKRPTIPQILLHPYFLTTGFGPFSF